MIISAQVSDHSHCACLACIRYPEMGQCTDADEAYQQHIFEVVDATVREYLAEGRGEPLAELPPGMPFMEAGLDSLDMLKVSTAAAACCSSVGLSQMICCMQLSFRAPARLLPLTIRVLCVSMTLTVVSC